MLKLCAFLRDEKEQAPRSVYNKFENLMTFLKANGSRGLVNKNDWPRFVKEEPEVYEKEELDKRDCCVAILGTHFGRSNLDAGQFWYSGFKFAAKF